MNIGAASQPLQEDFLVRIYLPFSLPPLLCWRWRLFKVSKVVSRQPVGGEESFGPEWLRAEGRGAASCRPELGPLPKPQSSRTEAQSGSARLFVNRSGAQPVKWFPVSSPGPKPCTSAGVCAGVRWRLTGNGWRGCR